MRARILFLKNNVAPIIKRGMFGRPPRCDAHMNELPVPCGPWEPWYTARQSVYNKIMVGGILWHIFSFCLMIWTDSIYLNFYPPLNPGPPSDMVEECDDSDT